MAYSGEQDISRSVQYIVLQTAAGSTLQGALGPGRVECGGTARNVISCTPCGV